MAGDGANFIELKAQPSYNVFFFCLLVCKSKNILSNFMWTWYRSVYLVLSSALCMFSEAEPEKQKQNIFGATSHEIIQLIGLIGWSAA